ncbi:MAG: uracil-DNA glycosylase [Rickettsiales bacterium]
MNPLQNNNEAFDALLWHSQMGVDLCVEADPQVLRAEIASVIVPPPTGGRLGGGLAGTNSVTEPPPQPSPGGGGSKVPPSSITDAVTEARTLADNATDLPALEAAVRSFNGCALKKTATNTVFAQGVPASRLMFIGEAPGAEEDRNGVPFCGPSGQLLDRMLSFIGLKRAENFYITNCLFWRPPGNRQPSADELAICRPLVEKHIALLNPKILVLVGGTATSAILRDTRGITRLRGQVFAYKNDYMQAEVPVHVLYHPSYLLRQPLAKKQAWADLLNLKSALTQI